MPIYDFKCEQCGHRFDLLTRVSQSAAATCPKCGGRALRVYEGKWSAGVRRAGSGGCGGNCSGCPGCGAR